MAPTLEEGSLEINASPAPRADHVRVALDGLRPGLLADGGNIELVAVEEDGTVWVELQGACADCAAAPLTLRLVIEPGLRNAVPGVTAVIVA
ncbi:MAG: NifU family protein [Deltaproteobacteria bacterium]|nr:NifU family protein [Deltaproteobacteria bacterium]MBW2415794.1 NifU family protein [Deltaproteobacteria bacterium]